MSLEQCSCYDGENCRCNGTRERDVCTCDGNRLNCNFYTYIREEAAESIKGQVGDKNLCPGPHILDSGDRTEFESGAVRDMRKGKGRCDLMPLDVVGEYTHDIIFHELNHFQKYSDVNCLYRCLDHFERHWDDGKTKESEEAIHMQRRSTMLLEVAKHFEDGAVKYGDNNWRKGIPVKFYIDSAIRHYLKFLRGDKDEPHDRAFCWNILCAIWTCKHHPELNEYAKEEAHEKEN